MVTARIFLALVKTAVENASANLSMNTALPAEAVGSDEPESEPVVRRSRRRSWREILQRGLPARL